jgi:hypothetical protein
MASNTYKFSAEEHPALPGSVYTPKISMSLRVGYFFVALIIGVCSGLANALISVNLGNIAGSVGLYVSEASVLTGIYVGMNACGNLILVKSRIQFGIPLIIKVLFPLYAIVALIQIASPGLTTAMIVRAISGLCAACLTTLTIYNLLQVFSEKLKPLAIVIGIAIPQLCTPIARLFPVEMLANSSWHGLHLIEFLLGLIPLAALLAFPLPPTDKARTLGYLDFLSYFLFAPAIVMFCCVLSLGKVLWWFDTPMLGWLLFLAIIMFVIGVLIELSRKEPLLHLEWLTSIDFLRFIAIALFVRIALAEQTFGAVGFLTSSGLNNDQLHTLFCCVILGIIFGTITSALTLTKTRLPYQVMFASLIIGLGAWMDSNSSNVTRPMQLYFSQALIGFGTTMFIGPALLYGFMKLLKKGGSFFITFALIFSMTQNLGGLIGSAILGTYQIERAKVHAAELANRMSKTDTQVLNRLQSNSQSLSNVIVDQNSRYEQAVGQLGKSLNQEANILSYNDVFFSVMLIALSIALFISLNLIYHKFRQNFTSKESYQ